LYCYSHGIFSSRRIERATYRDVAVRYICANRRPDHDTICTFRVRNKDAVAEAFLRILLLAREMKILKVGTVSVDGSKIKANASIHKSLRYDRAQELEQELNLEIGALLAKAESEDKVKDERGDDLDAELARLTILREKMKKAQEAMRNALGSVLGSSRQSTNGRSENGMTSRKDTKAPRSRNRMKRRGNRSRRTSQTRTAALCVRAARANTRSPTMPKP